ncbi:hypothetical protein G6F65_020812 [Rhizopus arrhizus]|nr:hypothetical protein G6F32_017379 [Rhizopus arrhizus]KAG1246198.1 hypothetical protein G6F65_020812 [Rhizopus arrhizus]
MIHVVFADLGGQVARGLHGRVQQDRLAAQLFGQPRGVKTPQRRADHGQGAGCVGAFQLAPGDAHGQVDRFPGAGGQLRTRPVGG